MNQLIVYLLTGYTSSKNMHIQVTSSWTARTSTDSFPSTKLSWTREKTVHCGTEKKKRKEKEKRQYSTVFVVFMAPPKMSIFRWTNAFNLARVSRTKYSAQHIFT